MTTIVTTTTKGAPTRIEQRGGTYFLLDSDGSETKDRAMSKATSSELCKHCGQPLLTDDQRPKRRATLRVSELATWTGEPASSLYRQISDGKIPHRRSSVGGSVRVEPLVAEAMRDCAPQSVLFEVAVAIDAGLGDDDVRELWRGKQNVVAIKARGGRPKGSGGPTSALRVATVLKKITTSADPKLTVAAPAVTENEGPDAEGTYREAWAARLERARNCIASAEAEEIKERGHTEARLSTTRDLGFAADDLDDLVDSLAWRIAVLEHATDPRLVAVGKAIERTAVPFAFEMERSVSAVDAVYDRMVTAPKAPKPRANTAVLEGAPRCCDTAGLLSR
jgi:hypothetical protein